MQIVRFTLFFLFLFIHYLGNGQVISNPSGFEIIEDDNNVLIKSNLNKKTFNVIGNNPYKLNFLKVNTTIKSGYCPIYNYDEIDIDKLIKNYPSLNIDRNYKFDCAGVQFNYYCGLNYTLISYSVSLYKYKDNEGFKIGLKSIFSIVTLNKKLTPIWYNNLDLHTDNICEFVISLDGKYFIKKGVIYENNLESNQIFLYSLVEKKILYNYLPSNPIENIKYNLSSFCASEDLFIVLDKKNEEPKNYYFNIRDKSIYEVVEYVNYERNISYENLDEVWDAKNKTMQFYSKGDKNRKKTIKSIIFKLIKKL